MYRRPLHNGIAPPFGYVLGARGGTNFMVNTVPRLSLHRLRLIERASLGWLPKG